MRTFITVLAIAQLTLAVAGIALKKSIAELPKWYFWALTSVALIMAGSMVYVQLS
ncbi:hypothetical protein [Streptomyces ehimensis]|uniref:Uncharacterized protein n=1 Tax=Streptomyces ehimensis TaxID=68195 RepID=A0ABV9BUW9_9ACTN